MDGRVLTRPSFYCPDASRGWFILHRLPACASYTDPLIVGCDKPHDTAMKGIIFCFLNFYNILYNYILPRKVAFSNLTQFLNNTCDCDE